MNFYQIITAADFYSFQKALSVSCAVCFKGPLRCLPASGSFKTSITRNTKNVEITELKNIVLSGLGLTKKQQLIKLKNE
jgi:hypothetical protein